MLKIQTNLKCLHFLVNDMNEYVLGALVCYEKIMKGDYSFELGEKTLLFCMEQIE